MPSKCKKTTPLWKLPDHELIGLFVCPFYREKRAVCYVKAVEIMSDDAIQERSKYIRYRYRNRKVSEKSLIAKCNEELMQYRCLTLVKEDGTEFKQVVLGCRRVEEQLDTLSKYILEYKTGLLDYKKRIKDFKRQIKAATLK